MADHIVTLNDRQENAVAAIVDAINNDPANPPKTPLSVDDWIRKTTLDPIKALIALQDFLKVQPVIEMLPSCTNEQVNYIKDYLGIPR